MASSSSPTTTLSRRRTQAPIPSSKKLSSFDDVVFQKCSSGKSPTKAQKKAEREQILHQQFEEKRKEQILKYTGSYIYTKNIDDTVSDEGPRDHFCACGTITSAKVMRDDKGKSKGFGFVCFSYTIHVSE
ncbi:hypothetical protein RYX36_012064 [Vicia faba]